MLHRLCHITANAQSMSIYSDGTLKKVVVVLPNGQTFEGAYGYTCANEQEKGEVKKTMEACSEQCGINHFIGRIERYADGFQFSGRCSHWLNACRIHASSNVGDWSSINQKRLYIDGLAVTPDTSAAVASLPNTSAESSTSDDSDRGKKMSARIPLNNVSNDQSNDDQARQRVDKRKSAATKTVEKRKNASKTSQEAK
jgi:hypothetical protein